LPRPPAPTSTLFPYTTLFRSRGQTESDPVRRSAIYKRVQRATARTLPYIPMWWPKNVVVMSNRLEGFSPHPAGDLSELAHARLKDRKSTRLNSSHVAISYAVF